MVRMLCSRSASLITSTRGSRAIAMTIFRMVSASAAAPRAHLVQLGDAVDQVRHRVAEVGAQPFQRVVGVLDRVVQQCGDQCRGVHAEFGEDRGDGQRMRDVRVAGLAPLVAVLLLGDVVGTLQQAEIGVGVQVTVDGGQRLEDLLDRGGALRRDTPRQPGPHPAGGRRLLTASGD